MTDQQEHPAPAAPSAYCIGVDVGGSHIAAAVASLAGHIAWKREEDLDCVPDGDRSLTCLLRLLDEARQQLPRDGDAVICVGAPGIIDYTQGSVSDARAVGWPQMALKVDLEERYRVPVLVENDVNLATLGEARFGAGRGVANLVCMFIGTNIGGGVVLDGSLYRGSHGGAGEIGRMVPEPALLKLNHAIDGCLENYAGGLGLARQATKALIADPRRGSAILEAAGGDPEAVRAEHIFAAAQRDDEMAREVLERAFDYLGVAVANIICLLDPDMIVIGGGVARAGDVILPAVRRRIAGLIAHQPVLALSQLGRDAVLLGALALGQDHLGRAPQSETTTS